MTTGEASHDRRISLREPEKLLILRIVSSAVLPCLLSFLPETLFFEDPDTVIASTQKPKKNGRRLGRAAARQAGVFATNLF